MNIEKFLLILNKIIEIIQLSIIIIFPLILITIHGSNEIKMTQKTNPLIIPNDIQPFIEPFKTDCENIQFLLSFLTNNRFEKTAEFKYKYRNKEIRRFQDVTCAKSNQFFSERKPFYSQEELEQEHDESFNKFKNYRQEKEDFLFKHWINYIFTAVALWKFQSAMRILVAYELRRFQKNFLLHFTDIENLQTYQWANSKGYLTTEIDKNLFKNQFELSLHHYLSYRLYD